jgi:membrane protease YdiL (CAAX protease family)
MGQAGSIAAREALPAWAGPLAAVLGFAAMAATAPRAAALGMRPALLLAELALVVPALLALGLFRVGPLEGLALRPTSRRTTLLALATGAAFWVTSLGLLELQAHFFPPEPGYIEAFRRLHEALRPRGVLDLLVSVAAIALVPALCEEIVLRGAVLPSLRPRLGETGAVGASSLLFALIHDRYRMPFTFVVGLGLGALRVRTGSLTPPVLAHAALNTITFLAAWALDDPLQDVSDPRPALGGALLAAGLLASAVALRASAAPSPASAPSPAPR